MMVSISDISQIMGSGCSIKLLRNSNVDELPAIYGKRTKNNVIIGAHNYSSILKPLNILDKLVLGSA